MAYDIFYQQQKIIYIRAYKSFIKEKWKLEEQWNICNKNVIYLTENI